MPTGYSPVRRADAPDRPTPPVDPSEATIHLRFPTPSVVERMGPGYLDALTRARDGDRSIPVRVDTLREIARLWGKAEARSHKAYNRRTALRRLQRNRDLHAAKWRELVEAVRTLQGRVFRSDDFSVRIPWGWRVLVIGNLAGASILLCEWLMRILG